MNGPVINRTVLEQQFPAGRLLRNTGASWDDPNRTVPYTDQVTAGLRPCNIHVASVGQDAGCDSG